MLVLQLAAACGAASHKGDAERAEGAGEGVADGGESARPSVRIDEFSSTGEAGELQDALERGHAAGENAYAVVPEPITVADCELAPKSIVVVKSLAEGQATIAFLCGATEKRGVVPSAGLRALTALDTDKMAEQVTVAATEGAKEVATVAAAPGVYNTADGAGGTSIDDAAVKPIACVARLGQFTVQRDIVPMPLKNCAEVRPASTEAEKQSVAADLRGRAQEHFDRSAANYRRAQQLLAELRQKRADLAAAYMFTHHDPGLKERAHQGPRDKLGAAVRADILRAIEAVDAQIRAYEQVPPPDALTSRSFANRAVLKCNLSRNVFNNGGRYGAQEYGIILESALVNDFSTVVSLDDHPAMPWSDGWGGSFKTNVDNDQKGRRITRRALADFIPSRASLGAPVVWFDFQAKDPKGVDVGEPCTVQVGLVR